MTPACQYPLVTPLHRHLLLFHRVQSFALFSADYISRQLSSRVIWASPRHRSYQCELRRAAHDVHVRAFSGHAEWRRAYTAHQLSSVKPPFNSLPAALFSPPPGSAATGEEWILLTGLCRRCWTQCLEEKPLFWALLTYDHAELQPPPLCRAWKERPFRVLTANEEEMMRMFLMRLRNKRKAIKASMFAWVRDWDVTYFRPQRCSCWANRVVFECHCICTLSGSVLHYYRHVFAVQKWIKAIVLLMK